jgi:phage shock protein PspC (stress-responsive transcriptional regulator)
MVTLITRLVLSLAITSLIFSPGLVLADVEGDINDQLRPIADVYDPEGEAGTESLAETVAQLIRVVLGFLGLLFIVLIIYAGFVWMTSAGNEERVSKAKKIMVAAIIGVAIVLAAYLITVFVIENLLEATGVEA